MKNPDPRFAATQKKKAGRPKGSRTNPNSPRMLAKAQKELEKASAILKQAGIPVPSKSSANSPGTMHTGSSPISNSPKPEVTTSTGNTPHSEIPAQSDTAIFGDLEVPERPAEHFAGGQPGPEPSPMPDENEPVQPGDIPEINEPAPEVVPPESDEEKKEQQRPLATMIWDSIVSLLTVFIGPFWQPRKVGANLQAGEIPYDERQMVIDAWCEYLVAVGMAILTPGQKLCAAIANYSFPRLFATLAVLREKMARKKRPANPQDARFAQTPPASPANPPEAKEVPAQ